MRISNNNALIKRNKKISQIVLYSALGLLTLSFLWSLNNQNTNLSTSYLILIPSYILVQVAIHMANRWGRSPRPDEIVVSSMKGLNDQYSVYNYSTGVNHLLVSPAGLWIIKPYHQSGSITYNPEKERFEQKGGGNFIIKLFAQEGLPNIEHGAEKALRDYHKYLNDNNIKIDIEPKVVNLFYSDKAEVSANNAPILTLPAGKFKDFLRKTAKKKSISETDLKKITDQLPEPTE
jgi:hypothetical protein